MLTSAEAVLARGGYDGLRVDDVLADCRACPPGPSTDTSRGKSELFVALFDARDDRARRAAADAAGGAAAGRRTQVRAWVAVDARPRLRPAPRPADAGLPGRQRQTLAAEFPDEIERCVRLLLEPLEAAIAAGRGRRRVPARETPRPTRCAIHHLCAGLMTDRVLGVGNVGRRRRRRAGRALRRSAHCRTAP